jgi:hypothetical protein
MLRAFMEVDFRAIWSTLSPSNRLFLLFFCGVSFYTPWVSFRAVLGLRGFKKEKGSSAPSLSGLGLYNLRKRLANLRQLHLFALYLLWFCIVINLPTAFDVMGLYKTYPLGPMLQKLAFFFYYYAPIFLAFVLLHSLQWFISARVEASLEESA